MNGTLINTTYRLRGNPKTSWSDVFMVVSDDAAVL